jgi:hypothetical protein
MDIQLLLRHLTTFKLDFGTLLTVLMVLIVNVTPFFGEPQLLQADNFVYSFELRPFIGHISYR